MKIISMIFTDLLYHKNVREMLRKQKQGISMKII